MLFIIVSTTKFEQVKLEHALTEIFVSVDPKSLCNLEFVDFLIIFEEITSFNRQTQNFASFVV